MSTTATTLADDWTALWNGRDDLTSILTDDFRIGFGAATGHDADALRGPGEFLKFVAAFRASHPGIRFAVDTAPVGDLDEQGDGRFAVPWHSADHSGIDLFLARAGKIAVVWSITGERRLNFAVF